MAGASYIENARGLAVTKLHSSLATLDIEQQCAVQRSVHFNEHRHAAVTITACHHFDLFFK